jgi:hypothetical protein
MTEHKILQKLISSNELLEIIRSYEIGRKQNREVSDRKLKKQIWKVDAKQYIFGQEIGGIVRT